MIFKAGSGLFLGKIWFNLVFQIPGQYGKGENIGEVKTCREDLQELEGILLL